MSDQISYTLKLSPRSRRVRIMVDYDGQVKVTAPSYVSQRMIEQFIQQKADWIHTQQEYFKQHPQSHVRIGSKKEYRQYKEQARKLVTERLEYFNKIYNFQYKKLYIRNQKSRWGSCSKHGNLSFNYKIVLLPPHLADYIVVHELCHLGQLNHSKEFWNLVAQTMPEYKKYRKELKGSQRLT